MSVPSTRQGGTVICTPSNWSTTPKSRSRWRTKASARALPPSDPSPMRAKLFSGSKVAGIEVAHRLPGLLAPVGVDLVDEVLPPLLDGGVVGRGARPQVMGQMELGAGLQPAGEIVALGVVGDGLRRHGAQQLEQAL